MPATTFRRVLGNLEGLQGLEIDLIGAEPTLNPALPELVAAAAESRLRPRLFSNGTLIDRRLAGELVRAGLRQATISLDGAEPSVHDRLRGVAGAQQRALEAISHLAEVGRGSGVLVSTLTVVTRDNYEEIPAIARLARERGAVRCAFHFASQVPEDVCRAPGVSSQYRAGGGRVLLDETDLARFRRVVRSTLQTERSVSLALLRVLGRSALLDGRFPVLRCRFVPTHLNLSSRGDAYPCSHLQGISWGSLAEAPWRELWAGEPRMAWIRRLRRALLPVCAFCCHHVHNLTLGQLLRVALGLPLGPM